MGFGGLVLICELVAVIQTSGADSPQWAFGTSLCAHLGDYGPMA
jgi:hypothetical protein